MTLERVGQLAQKHRFVTYSEIPDRNSVNRRTRAATAAMLPPNVLVTPLGCSAHLLWRVVVGAMQEDTLVGHLHAVWFSTRHSGNRAALVEAAQALAAECDIIPGEPPYPSWARHADGILQHTLLRTMCHTSGRVERVAVPRTDEIPGLLEGLRGSEPFHQRRVGAAFVKAFLNGDPRVRKLTHYCRGCCANLEQARHNVAAAIVVGGLLGGFSSQKPSKSRHGSSSEVVSS